MSPSSLAVTVDVGGLPMQALLIVTVEVMVETFSVFVTVEVGSLPPDKEHTSSQFATVEVGSPLPTEESSPQLLATL